MQARRATTRRSAPPARALAGLLLVTALALTGCSASDAGSDGGGKAAAPQQGSQAEGSQADGKAGAAGEAGSGRAGKSAPPELAAAHLIRTVSLSVQVKDTSKALDAARTATENAGGYVGDESTSRDAEGHERTEVTLRVPVERYEDVLDELEGAGKLLRREAKAEDVTDQVVDVDSRVKSQRASVARVRELMDRATELDDVVTLEGELSTRQAELEALLARQASLKDRTSLATVTLSLSETPVKHVEKKEDEDPGFLDALAGGWDAFVTMLRWLAVVLGAVLPFAMVAALLALLWLRVVRPRLPRRPQAPSGQEPGAGD
ncbi:DUF4349 domain-containing protein [Streptomyces coelicoflavus]|uniref:DUF4349 domain-containing protein n=1 Tax=Streptomyces coelicoflavus TaxID=285562 RepID=A0A6N9USN9_9ACTN|nr:DUF4349 domain-containing protein [Streptomyces coelicoflavus]NEB18102.1 DUF4349 domain-containing protein [Streptomyces coelicoflavus]